MMRRSSLGLRALASVAALLVAVIAFAAVVPLAARAEEPPVRLAVVVARDSKLNDLSIYELKRLYEGHPMSAGGTRLIPINLVPLSKDRVGFDRAVLGMTPEEVARYWIDRKIRGESGPPVTVDSAEVLQRVVVHLEGAVGYVRAGAVSDQVKVVRIDGKLPGDKEYPIVY
jgi:hypothetical protein